MSTDQSDQFADGFFEEPDHVDYSLLEEVIAHLDVLSQGDGFDHNTLLVQVVDPKSAAYVGMFRAIGYLGIENPMMLQHRMDEVLRLAVFWTEGLYAGVRLEQARG